MPRILGVDIPGDKRVDVSLGYLYGIGDATARKIVHDAGIEPNRKARELTEDEVSRIVSIIDKNFAVEGELRRIVAQNIARLRQINSYRGSRHVRGLPCRGQRTRTNARTRKGPAKTVAGKKAPPRGK
ncbi:MAG TPA: 30S ribosomal protein S13 [Planctomycetota bacterium]|nr:30S ribosomal protein S13 [Planctomycetota bacterium]HUW34464.1 30S ribosomal protein S13 [Planctomycetota bacterium]